MNKKQYAEYERSVAHNLRGLTHVSTGACTTCKECGVEITEDPDECLAETPEETERRREKLLERARELADESHFSWSDCDACGSPLGGNRHPAHGVSEKDGSLIHLDVCEDCLMYLNYNRLDDTQMMNMEDEDATQTS